MRIQVHNVDLTEAVVGDGFGAQFHPQLSNHLGSVHAVGGLTWHRSGAPGMHVLALPLSVAAMIIAELEGAFADAGQTHSLRHAVRELEEIRNHRQRTDQTALLPVVPLPSAGRPPMRLVPPPRAPWGN